MANNATPKQKNQILMLVILLLLLTAGGMFILYLRMNADLSISAENALMLSRRLELLEARQQKTNSMAPRAPAKKTVIDDLTKPFSLSVGVTKTVKYSIGPADEYGDITLVSYATGTKPQAVLKLQKREVGPTGEQTVSPDVTGTVNKAGDAVTSGSLSFGVVSFGMDEIVLQPSVALY